jgi:hypothetical protein
MASITFATVWYLPSENTWKDFNMLAFRDTGRLVVNADSLEYAGGKNRVVIGDIKRVTLGKQGRDFVNNWVKVEFGDGASAFFADGSLLGWGGILGGTQKIYAALSRFNRS